MGVNPDSCEVCKAEGGDLPGMNECDNCGIDCCYGCSVVQTVEPELVVFCSRCDDELNRHRPKDGESVPAWE